MSIALAKPEPRKRVKARADRAYDKARRACREAVYKREGMVCERCHRLTLRPNECIWEGNPAMAHVNERVPKSRGGNPLNPDECELVCQRCHIPNGRHAPTAERMRSLQRRTR